ncbi:MAG: tetratricopeptide repeat protein [Bdellovibrionales bacterium]|nr:tetratricopeptide repeat protein [Bdellovibrionales bacterium]
MKHLWWTLLSLPLLTACFTTRTQLREQSQLQNQVTTMQEAKANTDVRMEEFESQLRDFNGRIEVLENESRELKDKLAKEEDGKKLDNELLDNKFKIIQDALLKIESELQRLSGELEKLKIVDSKKSSATPSLGNYSQAEKDFANKKWKEAAVGFQKYRDLNPKGRRYSESTYKIGVCFQEMGMKEEAKAFYQEVLDKFPKSREASKAQYRLKNIK